MTEKLDLSKLSTAELRQLAAETTNLAQWKEMQADWEASWKDLYGKGIDRETSEAAILADPTEEEQARWSGMTQEEILADIDSYLDNKEAERIAGLRLVAEIDVLAREMHIVSSPRLRKYRRP